MTADEFNTLMVQKTDRELLGPCLRDAIVPFVFEPDPPTWDRFRADISLEFAINPDDITIVGSGRFGFSLKPWNNFKAYSDKSDIDVMVVNPELFDQLWYGLLRAIYPRPPMTDKIGGWLQERRKEVYTGWLSPLEVRLDRSIVGRQVQPVLDFRARWFNTFKKAARHPPLRHEDVVGRLYRTWEHAELYHLHNLSELRTAMRS